MFSINVDSLYFHLFPASPILTAVVCVGPSFVFVAKTRSIKSNLNRVCERIISSFLPNDTQDEMKAGSS